MPTSSDTLYCTEPSLISLTKKDATQVWPAKTRVKLTQGKVAMYVVCGAGGLSASGSAGGADVSGTVTASAGPWIGMNDTSASATEWVWVRSSADETYP